MIGVFDSGIGGLTVLKELVNAFPEQSFYYLGDTARLPYGIKSAETIRSYSEQVMSFLLEQNAELIVIACNTASSSYPNNEFHNVPVFNVIQPGAKQAIKHSLTENIGVLGTKATIRSQAYTQEIQKQAPHINVYGQACPLFVPLAEEAWINDPVTNLIAYRYIQPLLDKNLGALVLGCTHYPLLKTSIQKVVGNNIPLIESGVALAEELKDFLKTNTLKENSQPRKLQMGLTDYSESLALWAQEIMSPFSFDEIKKVTL